jgi:tetratricopeptide (TPR) repeat protein
MQLLKIYYLYNQNFKKMELVAVIGIVALFVVIDRLIEWFKHRRIQQEMVQQGKHLVQLRSHKQAVSYLDKVLKNTLSEEGLLARAESQLALCNYRAALRDADLVLHLNPKNAEAFLIKGQILYKNKQFKEAIEVLNQSIQHHRWNAAAYKWRGFAWLQIGNWKRGEDDLKKAVFMGDEDANYYFHTERRKAS